jgi:hypothetical protein
MEDAAQSLEKQYGFFGPLADEGVEEYMRCGNL